MISLDVDSLFAIVLLDKTIGICVNKINPVKLFQALTNNKFRGASVTYKREDYFI